MLEAEFSPRTDPFHFRFVTSDCGICGSAFKCGAGYPILSCALRCTKHRRERTCLPVRGSAFSGGVYGTEIYTDDSSICRAALHAGAVGREGGVVATATDGIDAYPSSTQNGVTSDSWGGWPRAFTVRRPEEAKVPTDRETVPSQDDGIAVQADQVDESGASDPSAMDWILGEWQSHVWAHRGTVTVRLYIGTSDRLVLGSCAGYRSDPRSQEDGVVFDFEPEAGNEACQTPGMFTLRRMHDDYAEIGSLMRATFGLLTEGIEFTGAVQACASSLGRRSARGSDTRSMNSVHSPSSSSRICTETARNPLNGGSPSVNPMRLRTPPWHSSPATLWTRVPVAILRFKPAPR
ncbi:hypothetical protein K3718_20390 (plasmid) [Leisingera aquaemixtae]|uniref:LCCL domain-containing protein n=1 Tax=Leisingera aquaemixtae TaxID=1396826 RepID=A0ABY5WR53_9RHOB|nr:hypothetical protein K3718_20390 [Leisingera aquaemixtae]